jgi:hypothetical protein
MSPPGDDERRPSDKDAAQCRETTTAADTSSLHHDTDNGEDDALCACCGRNHAELARFAERPRLAEEAAGPGYAAWYAQWQAHCVIEYEALTQAALRSLSTQQLRDIRWIGLRLGLVEDVRRAGPQG